MKEQQIELMTPDYWINAWADSRKNNPAENCFIRSSSEMIEYWNHFASKYDQVHSPLKNNPRVEEVINILQQEGFITPRAKVLDIGCGPGNYSIPLAELCSSITALDGAVEMCRQLKNNTGHLGIQNIKVLNKLWEEIDLKQENMVKKYDLVFASMTEAVSDYASLNAMINASKENCCLVFWAAAGINKARTELWQRIFNEPDPGFSMSSVIYPFNLLYSLGYYPAIRFINTEWSNEETVDEAVESLSQMFWLYIDINTKVENTITQYVKENAVNGTFMRKTEATLGIVTWKTSGAKENKGNNN
ncbi:MAG: class I SAM-dependent methyltransferase [Bacillota bacterium]